MKWCASLVFLIDFIIVAGCATKTIDNSRDENGELVLGSISRAVTVIAPSQLPILKPDHAISRYEQLLKEAESATVRAEALRRLADITLRNAEQRMLLESEGRSSELSPAQQAASFEKSVQLYQQLLHEFPHYKSRAAVQYHLAKAYDLMAEREASLDALASIARDFPADPQFAEAQFRRGEALFVERKWGDSDAAYSAVLSLGENTTFYNQSLYKRGWTRFKKAHYDSALMDFFPLLDRLYQQRQQEKQLQELTADTFRVIALSFSYVDGAVSVEQWFKDAGHKEYEAEVYRSLAHFYTQQERYKDAAEVYQTFVRNNRFHDESPSFQTAIIDTYTKGGFPSLVLPAKEAFALAYGRNSEYWMQRQVAGISAQHLLPQLKMHIRDVAQHYHAKAQGRKIAADYRVSARWYREYIDTFPQETDTAGLHFLMAEALFDAGDLPQAASEFEQVAYHYPSHVKSEIAAYTALSVFQNLIRSQDAVASGVAQSVARDKKSKNEAAHFPSAKDNVWRKPAIHSAQQFALHFNASDKTPGVLASLVNWQIAENDLVAAVASARQLLQLPQANALQKREARTSIANGEFDLGHFVAAELAFEDALNAGGLDAKSVTAFRERRAISIYKQAEAAVAGGDKRLAVQQFLRLGQVEPTSSVRTNAEYDAATLLLELEDWTAAINVLESFRTQYAKHPLTSGVTEKLAFAYEKNGQWSKAGDEYMRIAGSTHDVQLEREALLQAGVLFAKADNTEKTLTAYRHYINRFPQPYLLAQQARYGLIAIYTKLNDVEKRDFWRKELINSHHGERGEKPLSVTYWVAESAFSLTEPLFQSFEKIPLKLPLNKSIKAKRDAMTKALKAFDEISHYGIADFTVAAQYRMGEMYRMLASELMQSERPKGMDQDALDEYELLLEEQATPFEDKAIEMFENSMVYTKNGLYNQWIAKTLQALAKVNPARYGKTEHVEAFYQ